MGEEAGVWIEALRKSHERLSRVVEGLTSEEAAGPSRCDEWSVAQVLSHMGSGAEIHLAHVEAMLAGEPMPDRASYQAIWDRWDAKSADAMVADAVAGDERLVRRLEGLTSAELATLRWDFMGRTLDAAGIVGLRLGEHAAHVWDVEAVKDPSATVLTSSAELLVDALVPRVGRLARGDRPAAAPVDLAVTTDDPERRFVLHIGDDTTLVEGDGADTAGRLSTTGEAFYRLVYGRLGAPYTPASTVIDGPVSLDELRALFPGF
ncbi:MAG: maleylpyruvate isomerase N-terminal domain-containing protein [Actinomycetota bacterium]|nr:maleylpyruvate isomerase N-terminal domain-containing protein [Actinomycetota bacterium]